MKILVTYIDIKGSTDINNIKIKKEVTEFFYSKMKKIDGSFGNLQVKDIIYLGDGVINFCKADQLTKHELKDFIKSINKNVLEFEDESKKYKLKVGMAYGVYEDTQVSIKLDGSQKQKPAYITPAFDYASKASNLAKTFSIPETYVVIGKRADANNNMFNTELKKLLNELAEDNFLKYKESKSSKNGRFEVIDEK